MCIIMPFNFTRRDASPTAPRTLPVLALLAGPFAANYTLYLPGCHSECNVSLSSTPFVTTFAG